MVLTAAHLKHFSCVIDDLVGRQNSKIPGHKFNNWSQTVHGCTHGNSGKSQLCNRCVNDASGTKLIKHALRSLVSTVVFGNLFAHQENALITAHFLAHSLSNGFSKLYFAHESVIYNRSAKISHWEMEQNRNFK